MTYLPISINDQELAKKLMAQGATEDEAWSLIEDQYSEMREEADERFNEDY